MSTVDPNPTIEVPTANSPDPDRLNRLETSLRRHRVWLVTLTAVLGLFFISALALIGFMGFGLFGSSLTEVGVTDEAAAEAKREIQDAYGDRLQDVEVRPVNVKYGEAPFPYSLMSGASMKSLYVRYKLKGSAVTVADVMTDGPFGSDISATGVVPTKGSLKSRMTPEQFDRFLIAYARETKKPLGAVLRYGVSPYPTEPGTAVPDEVTVGNKAYPSKELWAASEGKIVQGDEVDMTSEMEGGRKALVFHEDPVSGEFTFLGTEPAMGMW